MECYALTRNSQIVAIDSLHVVAGITVCLFINEIILQRLKAYSSSFGVSVS